MENQALRLGKLFRRPGLKIRRCHQISQSLFFEALGSLLGSLELTSAQYGTLFVVSQYPGINQITLARLLGYDRTTVGGVVRHLENRGLIERRASASDKRRMTLQITEAALPALEIGAVISERTNETLLAPLSVQQRKDFLRALDIILDAHNDKARAPIETEAELRRRGELR